MTVQYLDHPLMPQSIILSAAPRSNLSRVSMSDAPVLLADLHERAAYYERHELAETTLRAYNSDWHAFAAWCGARVLSALPASDTTLRLYLTFRLESGLTVSTIERAAAAITTVHRVLGLESPRTDDVRRLIKGMRRERGKPPKRKRRVTLEILRQMVSSCPATLRGTRDRALILLGFASALRRSNLSELELSDLSLTDDGYQVLVRGSKSDAERRGRTLGVPYGEHLLTCPVRALWNWIDAAPIESGRLFRRVAKGNLVGQALGAKAIASIVKRALEACGMVASDYAAHSLRAGFCTHALLAGKPEWQVRGQSGHGPGGLEPYIRDVQLFEANPASDIGL